jgi:ferritin-like metal-binding protein YciE
MTEDIDQQLTKYLADAHSIEEQALIQLRAAPGIAGDPALAKIFAVHEEETEGHEQRVRDALEARGADPSKLKDVVAKAGGLGMLAFAKSQPDSPGKLTAHAYSYEHLELAAYELLGLLAQEAHDADVEELASDIAAEEDAMAQRLASSFDIAVEASLREVDGDDLDRHLNHYLADAHAIESQAISLLSAAPKLVDDPDLEKLFTGHLEATRGHEAQMRKRLEARGTSPSKVKDAALGIGGLNVGGFFAAQPDTSLKLVGFAFAFEHLEAAAYELLMRVADRAGDEETRGAAEVILGEERAQGDRVRSHFAAAVAVGLSEQGINH